MSVFSGLDILVTSSYASPLRAGNGKIRWPQYFVYLVYLFMWEDMEHETIRANIFMLVVKWKPRVTYFYIRKRFSAFCYDHCCPRKENNSMMITGPRLVPSPLIMKGHHSDIIIITVFAVLFHVKKKITLTFQLQLCIYAPLLQLNFNKKTTHSKDNLGRNCSFDMEHCSLHLWLHCQQLQAWVI